jgi:hypothetical protein
MTQKSRYPIIIYPAEEGGYVAEIPALKGCLAQGETQAECLKELKKVRLSGLRAQNAIMKKYQARRKLLRSYARWLREATKRHTKHKSNY